MTALALRNPLAVLMASIALIVFAAFTTPRMSVDTFPELTPPVLVVGTLVPGLGPRDVEKTITWRIEKFVSATPGVDHVESTSRGSLSVVYVWLKWGVDIDTAQTLVQQQVAFAMSSVPKSLGVIPPFVLQYDPSNAPVVQVAVSGGGLSGPRLYDYAQNEIEPLLEGIPGVASAAVNGGRQRQINVIVDATRAAARGITVRDISSAVAKANALLPTGEIISPQLEANVYTNAVPHHVGRLADALVKMADGRPVRIKDVARVEDGGAPETQAVIVDGKDAVYLNVLRVPGGNSIAIVDAVKKTVAELKGLPAGMRVETVFDQSTFVRAGYEGLRTEIFQALALIAAVILLFLQSVRGSLIVSIAIPLSFAATLLVLYASGQTLNAFTLGGLTLAMGPLVDVAVVVLESIHRHRARGLDRVEAALAGTRAVALPVLASTLTTMAVLLPIALFEGLARKLFAPLALTVAVSMIVSYVVSITVTPVACRYFLGHAKPGRIALAVSGAIDRFAAGYARVLASVLQHRMVLAAACALLVGGSIYAASKLPMSFFPEIDESMERVYLRFTAGTSLTEAREVVRRIGETLRAELPKGTVKLVLGNVGVPGNARSAMNSPNAGPHMGFLRLELSRPEERSLTQRALADRVREIIAERFPGVEQLQWPGGLVASVFANGYIAPIVLEVREDDLDRLATEVRALARVAREIPGVRDLYPSLQVDYPEVRLEIDREKSGLVGVSARAIAQTALDATLGNINQPSVWVDPRNGQSYYVVTRFDAGTVDDPSTLAQVPVLAGSGGAVPLGAYGRVLRGVGPVAVERSHLRRCAHLLMQTEGRDVGTVARELGDRLREDPRTRGIDYRFVGQVELMRSTFSGIGGAIGLAIMVVFMLMSAQFHSVRLPLAMLFTIPVSLVGIVLALLAAGEGFSITALMGILMVVGIAVSNGILMVDQARTLFSHGMEPLEAILNAARTRFVPIMMTSLATILGLLPTALGLEAGTEANRPLALAVVGGLTSSTLLSLFVVPMMFLALVGKRRLHHPHPPATPDEGTAHHHSS